MSSIRYVPDTCIYALTHGTTVDTCAGYINKWCHNLFTYVVKIVSKKV